MPIDPKNKRFFIHIPKTGGSSVREVLGMKKPDRKEEQKRLLFGNAKEGHFSQHGAICFHHMTLKELLSRGLIFEKDLDELFTIAFVRDPYTRIVSEFLFRNRPKGGFKEFLKKVVHKNYRDGTLYHFYFNHLVPQYEFIYKDGECVCDFLGRYEHLDDDISELKRITGSNKELPHLKNSKSPQDYMDFYDKECIDIVNEVYQKDFEHLNYKMVGSGQ